MYAPNPADPNPPIDLVDEGRSSSWWLCGAAALTALVVGFAVGVVFVGILPMLGVGAWRAGVVRRRGQNALATRPPGQPIVVKVARIGSGFQSIWSRPSATLTIGGGRVRLDGPGAFDLPANQVAFGTGSAWGKPGIFVGPTPTGPQRFTLVGSFDPASFWTWMVDRRLAPALEAARYANSFIATATPPTPSAPPGPPALGHPPRGTIDAGWYPDPAGSGPRRWWDGVGWTNHVG